MPREALRLPNDARRPQASQTGIVIGESAALSGPVAVSRDFTAMHFGQSPGQGKTDPKSAMRSLGCDSACVNISNTLGSRSFEIPIPVSEMVMATRRLQRREPARPRSESCLAAA